MSTTTATQSDTTVSPTVHFLWTDEQIASAKSSAHEALDRAEGVSNKAAKEGTNSFFQIFVKSVQTAVNQLGLGDGVNIETETKPVVTALKEGCDPAVDYCARGSNYVAKHATGSAIDLAANGSNRLWNWYKTEEKK